MNADAAHKLLARQLRRHFGSLDAVPEALAPFMTAVEMAYRQADADRALLERSLDTVSRELEGRLTALRQTIGERDEVRHAFSLLEASVEGAEFGVLIVDLTSRVVRHNARLLAMWPAVAAEVRAGEADALWRHIGSALEDPASLMAVRAAAEQGREPAEALRLADGRRIELTANPQRLDGVTLGWVFRFRDVTERHLLEEQLRQSQKMEAVGQLAGGVAHDFNNLLTIVRGNLDLLRDDVTLSGDAHELLDEVGRAAARAADLTRQLLAFGRKQTLRVSVFDLGETLTGIEPMLRRVIGANITLSADRDASATPVRADRGQLDQVVMNLVLNARDAMPAGGAIRLTTRLVRVSEARTVALGDVMPAGAYAELAVADTGSGIASDDLSRIFEPFYTTKPVGQGTGLGLAMVHGIVRQSHGFIDVESARGIGTTMRLLFPVAVEGAVAKAAVQPPAAAPAPAPGSQTILVAEDETAVRRLIKTLLRREGYTILEAANGREALEIIGSHPGPIHLVVSDVMMPELTGTALSRELRKERPELPVLLISGYTTPEGLGEADLAGGGFLGKPFTTDALSEAVRTAIAAAAPPGAG
jgi:two-component system cell cycle sensor histidine kinase/response regulator CckA